MPDVKVIAALRDSGGTGTMVHEYDQGKDKRIAESDLTSDGWCLGVSAHWVKHKILGTDFWAWLQTPAAASAFRFLMASQAVRQASANLGNVLERATFALKNEAKVTKQEIRANSTSNPEQFAKDIVNTPGKYAVANVSWANSGHFWAAMVEGEVVTFMDPNAGEMRFPKKADFIKFMPRLFKAMNYSTAMVATIVDKLDKK